MKKTQNPDTHRFFEGYAYVNFHSAADAERVMDTLNYSTIKGRCCRIMWSHRDPNLRKTGNGNVFLLQEHWFTILQ